MFYNKKKKKNPENFGLYIAYCPALLIILLLLKMDFHTRDSFERCEFLFSFSQGYTSRVHILFILTCLNTTCIQSV